MTANAMQSDRDACLAAGMNSHVGKPFDLNDLVNTIIEHTHWEVVDPVLVSESSVVAEPSHLDIDSAIKRMSGSKDLYFKVLGSFANDAAEYIQKIESLHGAHEHQALNRLFHTVKGVSATVGAALLSQAAAGLEKLTVDSAHDILQSHEYALFKDVLVDTMKIVQPMLGNKEVHAPNDVDLSADCKLELSKIIPFLQRSDLHALEFYAEFQLTYTDVLGGRLEALDAAMSDLDFEAALRCVEALLTHK